MTLAQVISEMFSKRASSPAQRAVNAGAPNAAENPTEAQKRVGNYQKVHLNIDGFRISIENPKGSVRSGAAPDGTKWSNVLACDCGNITRQAFDAARGEGHFLDLLWGGFPGADAPSIGTDKTVYSKEGAR